MVDYTHCCLWKWPRQKMKQFVDAVIRMQEKSASKAIASGMHPSCDSPKAFRRFALGGSSALVGSSACLVGENPTCSVPAW